MFLFDLQSNITVNLLLSCFELALSAFLSYFLIVLHLYVKHVSHRLIVHLHRFSLVQGTHWSFYGPLCMRIELGLFVLGFHSLFPPFHLLQPEIVISLLFVLLFFVFTFFIQLKLLDFLLELCTLLECFVPHALEISVIGV